jgi:hypothetical protein
MRRAGLHVIETEAGRIRLRAFEEGLILGGSADRVLTNGHGPNPIMA